MKKLSYGGSIITMEDNRYTDALLTEDDAIIGTGSREDLMDFAEDAEEVNLDGAVLMPGFIDPHSHYSQVASGLLQVSLDGASSFEEMKKGLDLRSKSGIHRLINALVERGFLERLPNKARALEVKRLPDNTPPISGNVTQIKTLAESPSRNRRVAANQSLRYNNDDTVVQLPLYGKIAAGTPIEALRNEQDTVDFPISMLGKSPCYALTIEGDSMINAGIMDGDIVVIEKCDRANDGDIVVALVDGEEATLKRLRREIGMIVLMPENPAYQPIRLSPDRVQIQGKLRSLFRTY